MSEQDEKQRLIKQLGSLDDYVAANAAWQLRQRGWLTDGSLNGADFLGANLEGVNLEDAILRNAVLRETNFEFAGLRRADLRSANLLYANLHRTDLSNANLTEAFLGGAVIRRVRWNNADLTNAQFGDTILIDVDLSVVKGLETVWHSMPSTIDIDTLYLSQGKIPEVFLRGCGVPDTMIAFARSLVESPIDFYSCFISYSHDDKSFARRVYDTLQGRGIRCWLDEHQMLPGDSIHEEIDRGIRIWDKVLLCCSEASLNSWWVEREVNKALQKEEQLSKRHGKKVRVLIPLDLDGYIFNGECDSWIARTAKERLAANFNGWEHDNVLFEREIERVIRAMRTVGGKEPPPDPKL